jgi:tetratricopeptide (TPR) repeat protein
MTMLKRVPLFAVLFLCLQPAQSKQPGTSSEPARIAQAAFYALEANPWDGEIIDGAVKDLLRAYESAPTDPWVLIGISRALLAQGYIKGDRADLSSYEADKVAAALDFANRAVEHGNANDMAHVALARMQIITKNERGAWESLNKAHSLDPQAFYPWYYRAVVSLKMRDYKRGADALREAEKHATMKYQREWVVGRMINVAELTNNVQEQETYYKRMIELSPTDATRYGNYALFLKTHKRYDEAITFYKKAISIRPYGLAVEQLKQTELLRDAARQQQQLFDADKAKGKRS